MTTCASKAVEPAVEHLHARSTTQLPRRRARLLGPVEYPVGGTQGAQVGYLRDIGLGAKNHREHGRR